MLNLSDFELRYGNKKIFNGINISFKPGEISVITGHSGEGKSSLLKAINGIIPEYEEARLKGGITYRDRSLKELSILERSKFISTVFQNPKTQFYCINSTDELAF